MPLVRESFRVPEGRWLTAKVLLDYMQEAVSPRMPPLGRGKGVAGPNPNGGREASPGAAYTLVWSVSGAYQAGMRRWACKTAVVS